MVIKMSYLYEMFNFREIPYDTIIPFNNNTMHHEMKSIRCVGANLWMEFAE